MAERDDVWAGQMRKGVAEFCVLLLLGRKEAYGYEILSRLHDYPALSLKESSLYLLLARLKKENFVADRQVPSEKGPPRRYFRLTAKGRQRMNGMKVFWNTFSADVQNFALDCEEN